MQHSPTNKSLCSINVLEPADCHEFHISDPDIMQPITEKELNEWYLEYGLPTNVQGRVSKMEDKGKYLSHPLGIGPTLTSSDRLAHTVLQEPKAKQEHQSRHASVGKIKTKPWWVPKKCSESPEVE